MDIKNIKYDCVEFKGNVPCKPNKIFNVSCNNYKGLKCDYYRPIDKRILIIKLGAAGDVIRTTPILRKLKYEMPNSQITWLTDYPELVPTLSDNKFGVNIVYAYNNISLNIIQESSYDIVINLDKDLHACALANKFIKKSIVKGFILKNNLPYPANKNSFSKYLTGLFDDISKNNTKSYLEETFEICGFNFNKEEYVLPDYSCVLSDVNIDKTRVVVGLNTGCGNRWSSRLWKFDYWVTLSKMLKNNDFEVVLLGGPDEDEKNHIISKTVNVKYFGVKDLRKFICLMDMCNIIVSAVTMAAHIAIGLKKKLVLMNNIFNKNEFELYGRGIIIEPTKKCTCYFSPKCTNKEYKCIDFIDPNDVFNAINILK